MSASVFPGPLDVRHCLRVYLVLAIVPPDVLGARLLGPLGA